MIEFASEPEPSWPDRAAPRRSVVVSIVNYRAAPLVLECLRSLRDDVLALDGQVVIADNDSGDDSVRVLEDAIARDGQSGWVRVLPLATNGGFAAGNNAVIRAVLRDDRPPRYVLLLNPDTRIRPGAVRTLVEFMQAHPTAAIAGSQCEDEDGTPRRSAFRFHSALDEFETEARSRMLSRVLGREFAAAPGGPSRPVDWVSGAAMILRVDVLREVGLLDEGYFLYYEETDLCRRAARARLQTWHVPASRVVHLCGRSTGVTGADRHLRPVPRYWFESRRRYFVKHHGRVYAALADLAWLVGGALARARRGKPADDPPRRYRDFLRYNLRGLP